MKFKTIHKKAVQVDNLIDNYIKTKKAIFVPANHLQDIVHATFPDSVMTSYGFHKLVFLLRNKNHKLAFKIGKKQAIENDHQAYKQIPRNMRHVYFARIFWHTKYCLLQEYGAETEVTSQELSQLRAIASKYALLDISCENIRNVKGHLKIIDATISPRRYYKLWKAADFLMLRLPYLLRHILRKSWLLKLLSGK